MPRMSFDAQAGFVLRAFIPLIKNKLKVELTKHLSEIAQSELDGKRGTVRKGRLGEATAGHQRLIGLQLKAWCRPD